MTSWHRQLSGSKLEKRRLQGRERFAQRKALKLDAPYEKVNYLDILERDGWHCQLCGLAISKVVKYPDPMSASLDHILPLTAGGHHIAANLQAAHMGCNAAKSNRPVGDQLRMIA